MRSCDGNDGTTMRGAVQREGFHFERVHATPSSIRKSGARCPAAPAHLCRRLRHGAHLRRAQLYAPDDFRHGRLPQARVLPLRRREWVERALSADACDRLDAGGRRREKKRQVENTASAALERGQNA